MAVSNPMASLQDELRIASALLQLLKQEQATLIEATIDTLPELTRIKAVHIHELGGLAKKRHAALGAAGFTASEDGMRTWVDTQPASSAAPALWNELLKLATEAKELNRVNGMLVAKHLLRNQTELNILQGKPQSGNIYGPDGQSTGKGLGRGLAVG